MKCFEWYNSLFWEDGDCILSDNIVQFSKHHVPKFHHRLLNLNTFEFILKTSHMDWSKLMDGISHYGNSGVIEQFKDPLYHNEITQFRLLLLLMSPCSYIISYKYFYPLIFLGTIVSIACKTVTEYFYIMLFGGFPVVQDFGWIIITFCGHLILALSTSIYFQIYLF